MNHDQDRIKYYFTSIRSLVQYAIKAKWETNQPKI